MKRFLLGCISIALTFCLLPVGSFAAFSDVPDGVWYAKAVQRLTQDGVLNGMEPDKFVPNGDVTRVQFAKMLAEFSGTDMTHFQDPYYYEVYAELFKDFPLEPAWWGSYAVWALDSDILAGSNGYLRPNDSISRQELAVMIARYLDLTYTQVPSLQKATVFTDGSVIAAWAAPSVTICQEAGLLSGYPDGTFRPESKVSRAESAHILLGLYFDGIVNAPNVPEADLSFADRLNDTMPKNETYLISPMSIEIALSLAANGAAGETQKEMLQVLGISDLNSYNTQLKALMSDYDAAKDVMTVSLANSLWGNSDSESFIGFTPQFLTAAQNYYGATVKKVNYGNAVKTVNDWVSQQTKGKVTEAIDNPDFAALLINTLYFKGTWASDFPTHLTQQDTFTALNGAAQKTDFMQQTDTFRYYATPGIQMVQLPYKTAFHDAKGELVSAEHMDVSMYLILSDDLSIDVDALISSAELRYTQLFLKMPKFEFSYSADNIKAALIKMGMTQAFADSADFSNMIAGYMRPISDIIHKTFIAVDEEGTEAAAVTVIEFPDSAAPPSVPTPFIADKPFLFVIRDDANGEILFMGQYVSAQ